MTFADRFDFEVSGEEPQPGVNIVPGWNPPEPPPIKPGDWVELRFAGTPLDIDVTEVAKDFLGVVRAVPPDLSPQLEGLKAGEEISFRYAHIFVVHHA